MGISREICFALFLLTGCLVCSGDGQKITFRDDYLYENSVCTQEDGKVGFCLKLSDCQESILVAIQKTHCTFIERTPVVCCTKKIQSPVVTDPEEDIGTRYRDPAAQEPIINTTVVEVAKSGSEDTQTDPNICSSLKKINCLKPDDRIDVCIKLTGCENIPDENGVISNDTTKCCGTDPSRENSIENMKGAAGNIQININDIRNELIKNNNDSSKEIYLQLDITLDLKSDTIETSVDLKSSPPLIHTENKYEDDDNSTEIDIRFSTSLHMTNLSYLENTIDDNKIDMEIMVYKITDVDTNANETEQSNVPVNRINDSNLKPSETVGNKTADVDSRLGEVEESVDNQIDRKNKNSHAQRACNRTTSADIIIREFKSDNYSETSYQSPSLVSFGLMTDDLIDLNCTGSLIEYYYVVTSASCVDNIRKKPNLARVGDYVIYANYGAMQPSYFVVNRIQIHPGFNRDTLENNIAILKLLPYENSPFPLRPICVWESSTLPTEGVFESHGYEKSDAEHEYDPTNTTIKFVSREDCEAAFKDDTRLRNGLTADQFCVTDENVESSCEWAKLHADEITTHVGAKRYLLGISSFGYSCKGGIRVYTRISSYIDWLTKNIWIL